MMRKGMRMENTEGLVTVTAGPDLVHILSTTRTMVVIRKILWYNNTGGTITLIFGTQDNAGVWVPLLPTIAAINGLDGGVEETLLPMVEFRVDRTPAPAGLTGNILVQASAVDLLLRIEVEEFGA